MDQQESGRQVHMMIAAEYVMANRHDVMKRARRNEKYYREEQKKDNWPVVLLECSIE
jgi:hypothetical protein